ncbi:enoyl-CoA hydratase-related protein [Mesorhizobium australicum]|uniref:Enoyl-CoA hydratase n=1 Tax=Mesorhizobium australicum TaxID=536018 RepID=A0A1X7MS44_9HYPH|nr:enoyl-CoA hydratase-related protein [Mesorhizobium australicum]SMH27650.1 Enoyl-CoA hydratase [Mesorhizobium australicum]
MDDVLLHDHKNGVLTITFNRPDARNAWNHELEDGLRGALLAADADPEVKVVVLTGSGKTFCPGPDPKAISAGTSQRRVAVSDDDFGQRYSYMLGLRKPLIAAVNGAAAGVGLCLALYCDLRFVAETARLTTAFARRGLVAEHGSAWMLPRLVGTMNAADLLLSGRVVGAREAEAMGLARCLPAEGFLDAVRAYAEDLAQNCSPRSMMIIKRQLHGAWSQSLARATTLANEETARSLEAADVKEGMAHFIEKRQARFPPLS